MGCLVKSLSDSRLSFFGQWVGEVFDVEQRKTEVEQWRGERPWNNENANVPRGTMEGSRGFFVKPLCVEQPQHPLDLSRRTAARTVNSDNNRRRSCVFMMFIARGTLAAKEMEAKESKIARRGTIG